MSKEIAGVALGFVTGLILTECLPKEWVAKSLGIVAGSVVAIMLHS